MHLIHVQQLSHPIHIHSSSGPDPLRFRLLLKRSAIFLPFILYAWIFFCLPISGFML
jgi:hypothetical protein